MTMPIPDPLPDPTNPSPYWIPGGTDGDGTPLPDTWIPASSPEPGRKR